MTGSGHLTLSIWKPGCEGLGSLSFCLSQTIPLALLGHGILPAVSLGKTPTTKLRSENHSTATSLSVPALIASDAKIQELDSQDSEVLHSAQ